MTQIHSSTALVPIATATSTQLAQPSLFSSVGNSAQRVFKQLTVPQNKTIGSIAAFAGGWSAKILKNLSPKIMYELTQRGFIRTGSGFGLPEWLSRRAAIAYMGVRGIPKMPKWVIVAVGATVAAATTGLLNEGYRRQKSVAQS